MQLKYVISVLTIIFILCILNEWMSGSFNEEFDVASQVTDTQTQNVLNTLNNYRFANFSELQTFINGLYNIPILIRFSA